MAKIFSALTLLVALGATFFGLQSKSLVEKLQESFRKEQQDLTDTKTKLTKTEASLKTAEDEAATAKGEAEKAKGDLTAAKEEAEKAKADLEPVKAMLKQKEETLADVQKQLVEMGGKGGDVTKLTEQLTALKTEKAELENKNKELEIVKAELSTKVETLNARAKDLEGKAASQGKVIERYTKNIMQQGVRGQVMAVNAGWGFCVLSIGDRQGAAANKVMIVTRGNQAIGKVKIINVEPSQSVADILPGTFARGTYVQPGDGVIYTGEDKVRAEEGAEGAAAGGTGPSIPLPELPKP